MPSAKRVRAKSADRGGPRPGGFSGLGLVVRPPPGGGPGGPRPGGFSGPPGPAASRRALTQAARPGGPRSRNFGPDAPPKNKRKPPRKDSERGPKGPIKERPVGRLYDADEDWRAQDEDVEVDNVATSAKDDEAAGETTADAAVETTVDTTVDAAGDDDKD